MNKPYATAVLLNHRKPDSLKRVIETIRAQEKEIEIILIDNSGNDGNAGFDCDRYFNAHGNLHCKARMLLAPYAKSDVIFTLDDDVLLNGRIALEPYADFLRDRPGLRTCAVLGYDHYKKLPGGNPQWQPVDFLKGRFMVFHRDYLKNVTIGFHDFIDHKCIRSNTGWGTPFVEEDWIGVDDMAFQLPASYVVVPTNGPSPITDQPSAGSGLWQRPGHLEARQEFRDIFGAAITRLTP